MAMDHPFIVSLKYAFYSPTQLFLVQEFCQGGDVYETMQARPEGHQQFTEGATRHIIAEVTLALGYLHNHDIAFRDLKPENVMFDSHGHVRLIDFGLAKPRFSATATLAGAAVAAQAAGTSSAHEESAGDSEVAAPTHGDKVGGEVVVAALTEADLRQTTCGTPLYMSPEGVYNHLCQTGGQHNEALEFGVPGLAADYWMLGVLTFELLTARTPFTGAGGMNILMRQILRHPPGWKPSDQREVSVLFLFLSCVVGEAE